MATPCLYVRQFGGNEFYPLNLFNGGESVSYTRQVNDLQNILVPRSSFVNQIVFLYDGKAKKVLGNDLQFDKGEKLTQEYEAILLANGNNLLEGIGRLYLQARTYEGSTDCDIVEALLVSGRGLWVPELKKCLISDLDMGTHIFDEQTVRNSWDRKGLNGTAFGQDYIGGVYLPINYGLFTGRPGLVQNHSVNIEDLRLSLYIKRVLQEGFAKIGWTLNGAWIDSQKAEGYIYPWRESKNLQIAPTPLSLRISDKTNYNLVNGSPWRSIANSRLDINSTYWNGNAGTWTVGYDQSFGVLIQFSGDYPSGAATGLDLVMSSDRQGELFRWDINAGLNNFSSPDFCLTRHEVISFTVEDQVLGAGERFIIDGNGTLPITQFSADRIENSPFSCPYVGREVDTAKNSTQGDTVLDVLQGLLNSVGLYAITSPGKKQVELIPIDEYYKLTIVRDISDLVDCSDTIEDDIYLSVCPNRLMRYKADEGDVALTEIETVQGIPWGANRVVKDSSGCSEDFINPFFAPTYQEINPDRDLAPDSVLGYWPNIGQFRENEAGVTSNYYDSEPRILYYEGLVEAPNANPVWAKTTSWEFDNGVTVSQENQLPYGYFFDALGLASEDSDNNLSFRAERIFDHSETPVGHLTNTLIGSYPKNFTYLDRLLESNRFVRIPLQLGISKLTRLDDRNLLYIHNKKVGIGGFLFSSLSDWNCSQEKASLLAALILPDCELNPCPKPEEIGFRVTATYSTDSPFNPVDNEIYFRVFMDDPNAIVVTFTQGDLLFNSKGVVSNLGTTWVFGAIDDPFYIPNTINTNLIGAQYPLPSAINNTFAPDALTYTRMLLNMRIRGEGFEQCTVNICYTYIATGRDDVEGGIRTLLEETSLDCQIRFQDFSLDQENCIVDFIEEDFTDLAGFASVMSGSRTYEIVEFTYDGAPAPFSNLWQESLDYALNDPITQGFPVQADAFGTYIFNNGTPNNSASYVAWFNGQFPSANDNPSITGAFGSFTAPVKLVLKGSNTFVQYTTSAPWRLVIRRKGTQDVDTLLEWDGNNLIYSVTLAGVPFPPAFPGLNQC